MTKRVGIMQPYFLPYIGYWQLIHACDEFVIYDEIQHTKKGWINRNRFLLNGQDELFSLPLKQGSSQAEIVDRFIADDFDPQKLLRRFTSSYQKAPFYKDAFPVIEQILLYPNRNLFDYIFHSIKTIMAYLDIKTPTVISSSLSIDKHLRAADRVIAICKSLNATDYLNPIGGVDLYNKADFSSQNLNLNFLKTSTIEYKQFSNDFIPHLSILDVMMFNSKEQIKLFLDKWDMH